MPIDRQPEPRRRTPLLAAALGGACAGAVRALITWLLARFTDPQG